MAVPIRGVLRTCSGGDAMNKLAAIPLCIAAAAGDVLKRLGHKVYWWDEWTWLAGAPCTIVVDHKTGVMHGGADPRRPAYALGW